MVQVPSRPHQRVLLPREGSFFAYPASLPAKLLPSHLFQLSTDASRLKEESHQWKQMKLKKEFYIKGKLWRIEYKWNLRMGDMRVDGMCEPSERIIYIDRILSKEEKWATFLHELGHAIVHEAHLNEHGGLDGFAEEVVVESYAQALGELFTFRWKRK